MRYVNAEDVWSSSRCCSIYILVEACDFISHPLKLGLKHSNKASNVFPGQKVSGAGTGIFIQMANKSPSCSSLQLDTDR